MKANEINVMESTLSVLFDNAIRNAIKKMYAILAPGKKAQEPDYVAALTRYFTEDLSSLLNTIYPSYNFTVSSVFCHQKPIVRIGPQKKPELGDILFVYSEEQDDGSVLYNSLLLQAKITDRPILKVSNADMHQLELYKNWPLFTYHRANLLNGLRRNIQPKAINDGAQYLLIDDNPITNGLMWQINAFPMGCAIPNETLILDKSLSAELVDFLKFKAGRVFEADPRATDDDWTKMIWDLLLMGAYCYNRRNIGHVNVRRGIYYSYDKDFARTDMWNKLKRYVDDLDGHTLEEISEDESRGVSVVIIESKKNRSDR